jgi:hypothetical protein
MDDIYLGGNSELDHLKIVFDRLFQHNLKIRISKTKFFVAEIKMLGVVYSATGKKIDPDKIAAIQKFGEINTLKKLQCFLGMLAYVASFIPHFSTVCAPLYALLRKTNQPFGLTSEALEAYRVLKEYIGQTTLLYHVNLDKELYLSTDASNVAVGGFLYQITVYEKNDRGYQQMMKDLGFKIEKGAPAHLLPGVSPGKNTPVVTEFLNDKSLLKKFDQLNTLDPNLTMTEKIKHIDENYVLNVNPVGFYSKSFTEQQVLRYATMEKEFLGMMYCVLNYKDYLQAAPVTYILTDSQPVCWALKHKDDHVKLARYLLKLFELNINIIVTHVAGIRNSVADFLSRIYYVPEKAKDTLGPKQAQHIVTPFNYLSVLTPDDVLKGFRAEMVTPCAEPTLCHLNVNNFLFKNLGPFNVTYTCLDKAAEVKTAHVAKSNTFCFSPESLNKHLTLNSIFSHQQKDEKIQRILQAINNGEPAGQYCIQNQVVCKKFKEEDRPCVVVVPRSLIMYVLASSHFISHAGPDKMFALVKLKYFWKNMFQDIQNFCKGCVLCQIYKTPTQGPNEIGTPRMVLGFGKAWQIDICSGLTAVRGYKSFLNVIDMYSGFTIPIPLKKETSEEIASKLENQVIKIFGPPGEISSDNAANLGGPPMKRLCKFYNIILRQTVPYSPTSHSLIENSNRYVTQLTRIFSDQFQAHWIDVISLAALVFNAIPRPQLSNHSPYFFVFAKECFENNDLSVRDNRDLDVSEYLKRTMNDRIYVRVLRERLLKIREQRNAQKHQKYHSFPPGTLILVRDNRPRVHKKLKPIFHKLPQKVIKEYRCTIYSEDVFGRVFKHSKNNIKIASDRSAELFGKLPMEIKIVLGDEFNADRWQDIKNSGVVPAYLLDIQISGGSGVITRGRITNEPNVAPVTPDENDTVLEPDEDMGELDDILDDRIVRQLNELHAAELLNDPGIGLGDVPRLYSNNREIIRDGGTSRPNLGVDPDDLLLDGGFDAGETQSPPPPRRRPSFGVDPANILPAGVRRRVRFNLPTN